jgi:hypothetical protein
VRDVAVVVQKLLEVRGELAAEVVSLPQEKLDALCDELDE